MAKRSPDFEEGECSDDEPEVKKGKYEDLGDFVIDTSIEIINDHGEEESEQSEKNGEKKKESNSKWEQMMLKGLLREVNPEEIKEDKKRRRNCCWNCGGDHVITNCPEPKDLNRIRKAKMEHNDRKQTTTSRYHVEESKDTDAKYKPGRLSTKLREALNIGPDDIPDWIYRMRRMGFHKGYPPGYLRKALKIDPTTSLLQIHSSSTDFVGCDSSVPRPSPIVDSTKVLYYMGFNNTYRSLHDLEQFKVPPFELFCENLQKDVELKHNADERIRIFEENEQKRRKTMIRTNEEKKDLNEIVEIDRNKNEIGDNADEDEQKNGNKETESKDDDTSMGDSISLHVGTPIMSRRGVDGSWKRDSLPDLDKFSVGIVPFEAKEEDGGQKGIFKRIMGKIKNLATGDSSKK